MTEWCVFVEPVFDRLLSTFMIKIHLISMYSVYNYFYKYVNIIYISSCQRPQIVVTALYQPSEESWWEDSDDEDEDDKDDKKPLQDKPQTQLKW